MARGIVGDLQGQLVVASPVYKQHFNLRTGRCLEDESVGLRTWPCGVLDGRVWVERAAGVRGRRPAGVGAWSWWAMAWRPCAPSKQLLSDAPDTYDITIFGAEPRGNYNRILLSPLLAGEMDARADRTACPAVVSRARHHAACRRSGGVHRSPAAPGDVGCGRRRRTTTGCCWPRARIRCGSRCRGRTWPACSISAAWMTWTACSSGRANARQRRRDRRRPAGTGGGQRAWRRQGLDVTVVHIRDRVMDRQLDDEAAAYLRAIHGRHGASHSAWLRAPQRSWAMGAWSRSCSRTARSCRRSWWWWRRASRPRTDLARDCGLHCDRGILVDDTLQTFDPAIYAVGECVQHRGTTYGLVAPLWEQARVCAAHLAERGVAAIRGSSPACATEGDAASTCFPPATIATAAAPNRIRYPIARRASTSASGSRAIACRPRCSMAIRATPAWYRGTDRAAARCLGAARHAAAGGPRRRPGAAA